MRRRWLRETGRARFVGKDVQLVEHPAATLPRDSAPRGRCYPCPVGTVAAGRLRSREKKIKKFLMPENHARLRFVAARFT